MQQQQQQGLWSEWFWLPPGFTWQDLARDDNDDRMFKAQMSDLWVSGVCAMAIYCLRVTISALILRPLGRSFQLRDRKFEARTPEERGLEAAYQQSGQNADYATLAKKLGRTETWVRNWFRRRRNYSKSNLLTKFVESGWQIVFYSFSCVYGLAVLWHESYFWDTAEIWRGWPEHHVKRGVYWYYMIELGFYWTALATVCSDTKRKDFHEMVLHHFVTIVLMVFSWTLNFTRIGVLILLLHDTSDPIFNLAKIGSYTKVAWISDPAFICFLAVWFTSRLGVYPFRILRTSLFELDAECGTCPALKILQGFLLVLQLLHVVWSYFIAKVAFRVVVSGDRRDTRSDSEEEVN